jgi:hypothetical protein
MKCARHLNQIPGLVFQLPAWQFNQLMKLKFLSKLLRFHSLEMMMMMMMMMTTTTTTTTTMMMMESKGTYRHRRHSK